MVGAKKRTPTIRRNYQLAPGVMRFSAARMYHKRGVALSKKTPIAKKKIATVEKTIEKKIEGEKNGGIRKVPVNKGAKLLAEDRNLDKKVRNSGKVKKVALRSSITPGTVLIILAGRHKGKRVVFLKQLEKTGLLLVTGPHKYNNTPLRRIAQAFVIATKTKLDISGVSIPTHLNDEYFRRKIAKKTKKGEQANIFAAGHEEYKVSDERKADQKALDKQIIAVIKKHPERATLRGYLCSRFSLEKRQYPHALVF